MWDIKLLIIFTISLLNEMVFYYFDLLLFYFHFYIFNGFLMFKVLTFLSSSKNMVIFFTFKFIFCISFLILIRGGTPRYRYDFLTKLGWLKFLSLILLLFSLDLFFYFILTI